MLSGDISNRNDIIKLVDAFYEKVKADELLGPIFSGIDLQAHMPTMYDFWSSMLLGDMSYKGNPLQKHLQLKIGAMHFKRWLEIFTQTVDEYFSGPNATEIKGRAVSIAAIFQHKMGIIS